MVSLFRHRHLVKASTGIRRARHQDAQPRGRQATSLFQVLQVLLVAHQLGRLPFPARQVRRMGRHSMKSSKTSSRVCLAPRTDQELLRLPDRQDRRVQSQGLVAAEKRLMKGLDWTSPNDIDTPHVPYSLYWSEIFTQTIDSLHFSRPLDVDHGVYEDWGKAP